jgi:hypothetical protein
MMIEGGMMGPTMEVRRSAPRRSFRRIARLLHHVDEHVAGAGHVGQRRAADAGKEGDGEDVGVASPPRTRPTSWLAKRSSTSVSAPPVISSAARMKKGIASSGKLSAR